MHGFRVLKPGVHSLLQDYGRLGHQHLGLSNGGPADPVAFGFANKLLRNPNNSTCVEISVGGLELQSRARTLISVCGADMALSINGNDAALWRSHPVHPGDYIKLGYAQHGLRAYLAVQGGFTVKPQFGSTSTVVREEIGGLDGHALSVGSWLPCSQSPQIPLAKVSKDAIPDYQEKLCLRLVPGYQYNEFSEEALETLFNNDFTVGQRSDRMAYQLEGPHIATPDSSIVSEGNAFGALQITPEGEAFVLLNDRQTIGGYPKPGSVLSTDCMKLAQRQPGARVHFEETSVEVAQRVLLENSISFENSLEPI